MKYRRRLPSPLDRKSTRLNSSHQISSYAVFCLNKKKSPASRSTDIENAYGSGGTCTCALSQSVRGDYSVTHSNQILEYFQRLFCFNSTSPTEIYTLSLHDALPI